MSHSVTVTCSFDVEIPDGYEYVRYGIPKNGELYFSTGINDVVKATCDDREYETEENKRVILKKIVPYTWPDYIKSGTWMAMDDDGKWYLFDTKPSLMIAGIWNNNGDSRSKNSPLNIRGYFIDFPVPKCSDWTKSLIQKS